MIVLADGVENRTRSVCRMTIVPMLRVGMPFVTLCVTMLRRTARSRSDAERPGLRYHAERGSDESIRPQRPVNPPALASVPGNTRRPAAHRRCSIDVQ